MLVKHILQQGLLLKNAGALSRAMSSGHGSSHGPTMNDLPSPAGDWYEHHARRNSKYNAVLITGILVLGGTLAFVKTSGVISLNYSPPKSLD